MKIILKAFGYLESKVMEVPENTTTKFELALMQPLVVMNYKDILPIQTIAEFEWTGNWITFGVEEDAREYILTNIHNK